MFYCPSILRLKLSPLRERLSDTPSLAEDFLKQSLAELGVSFLEPVREGSGLSQPTLLNYGWPGDAHELRDMMERLALLLSVESQPELNVSFLQQLLPKLSVAIVASHISSSLTLRQMLAQFSGDRTAAAQYLGIGRTALWRRLKEKPPVQ